ncbi:MAG: hypothetical protein QM704_26995 [Anaeromyxobacteraceae bacterium]
MNFRPLAAALPFALAACAWSGPGVPMKLDAASAAPALAPGEVVPAAKLVLVNNGSTAGEAVFQPWKVDGDHIDVERGPDGTWIGVVQADVPRSQRGVGASRGAVHTRLTVSDGRITGAGLSLAIFDEAATGTVTIHGFVGASKVNVTMTKDEIRTNALRLVKKGANVWRGEGWPSGHATLQLEEGSPAAPRGAAFYLALVDTLISGPTLPEAAMTSRLLAAALPFALAACAWTGPGAPMKLDAAATASAGARLAFASGRQVRFGGGRVDGPDLDLVRDADGAWVGTVHTFYLRDDVVEPVTLHTRLRVEPGRIVGDGVVLNVFDDAEHGTVTIRGKIGDERVFVALGRDELRGQTSTWERVSEFAWGKDGKAALEVVGASGEDLRSPPFLLALVDAID